MSYLSGFTGQDVSRNTLSLTMTDGTKGLMFPGSFSYRRHKVSDQGRHFTENEFRGGFGVRINPRLSVGVAAAHLNAEGPGGLGFSQTQFDVGMLIGLQPDWGLSITGENLIEGEANVPESLRRPSQVAIGTQYIFERAITARYEVLRPIYLDNSGLLAHRFGVSFQMKGHFALNGGYSVDDTLGQNWATVGVAWRGPRLKLAYSLQNEARSGLGNRHFVDLWLDI
jgi:hypothetical protein